MLISKTPFRVSFFGGGTDFPEYFNNTSAKVIGTTIDKFIYITNNSYDQTSNINIKLFYSEIEMVNNFQKINNDVKLK